MKQTRMLPALLKHFRRLRGLSQLDLASAADISPKHLSFLETGRAKPSRDMVLRLGATLGLSLRDQNTLLLASGFSENFRESGIGEMSPAVRRALERMLAAHEPFPLVVFDANYDIRMLNHGAQALLSLFLPRLQSGVRANAVELIFDPDGLRPYFENWPAMAQYLLQRVTREHLATGRDTLQLLLSRLRAYPDVPESVAQVELAAPIEPVLDVRFRFQGQSFGFLTTITSFSAPQDVTLEELRIESYFPLDDATTHMCEQLARVVAKR